MKNDPIRSYNFLPFALLLSIYTTSYVIAVLQGVKLIDLWGFLLPGGYFAASLTFPCTDIISEIYGKKVARKLVLCGVLALSTVLVCIQVDMALPAASEWIYEDSYADIFGFGFRLILAGIFSFVIAQNVDIYLFDYFKNLTNNKYLWLRNNTSTGLSKLIDCILYNCIGFWGHYDIHTLIQFTLTSYVFYLILAILDTPLVYGGVWLIRKTQTGLQDKCV